MGTTRQVRGQWFAVPNGPGTDVGPFTTQEMAQEWLDSPPTRLAAERGALSAMLHNMASEMDAGASRWDADAELRVWHPREERERKAEACRLTARNLRRAAALLREPPEARVLQEVGDFAACHHDQQPGNELLHALIVDIPYMVEQAIGDWQPATAEPMETALGALLDEIVERQGKPFPPTEFYPWKRSWVQRLRGAR